VSKIKSTEEYRDAIEELTNEAEAHLRKNGWKHTCNTLGCFWMWEKRFDGHVYLVEFETAIRIQSYYEVKEEEMT
jgi:hypothetical protein